MTTKRLPTLKRIQVDYGPNQSDEDSGIAIATVGKGFHMEDEGETTLSLVFGLFKKLQGFQGESSLSSAI